MALDPDDLTRLAADLDQAEAGEGVFSDQLQLGFR